MTDIQSGYKQRGTTYLADAWIANSLMQKAIRRGDSELAEWAAASFHILRGSAIWRRLIIIAVEDIGVGAIDSVIKTVRACSDLSYRRTAGGNAAVIADLVRELASARKDRSADHLIGAAAEHPKLEAARRRMASLDSAGRIEVLLDRELPLTVRAVAAWYASGLQWFREQRMCGGDLEALLESYRALGCSDGLIAATGIAARRTREPLTVVLPLISIAAQDARTHSQSEIGLFPATEEIEGIPLYAFDMHTRLGRQALERLLHEDPTIRAVVTRYVPDRSGRDAVRIAAFHVDAALSALRFAWEHGRTFEALGIEADLLSAGVMREGHAAMLDAVRRRLDHLNELRKRVYRASGLRLCR